MYLTEFEMQTLARELRRGLQTGRLVLATHDPVTGWPRDTVDVLYSVVVPDVFRKAATSQSVLCRMLREKFDPTETAPWAFVPGESEWDVWLAPCRSIDKPPTS